MGWQAAAASGCDVYSRTAASSFQPYRAMETRAETVVITHIVTKDTVDARVLKALAEKDRIQEALIDAVKAEVRNGN